MPNWLSRKLNSPLRQSGGTPSGYNDQYGGVAPQSAYDMPGYQQRAGELSGFAKDRGGGPFRGQQEELSNMLMAQARGEQSYSAEQLRQNAGRMQSMQQSMAAGARPSQSAMANRMAMQGASRIGTDMIGQQALAGIAERNAAAQSLGGVLQGARGQDIDAYLGAQGLGLQNAAGQQAGQLGREQIRANRYDTAMGSPSNKEALIGALTGVGAGLGKVLSDDKSKVGIQPAGRDVDKLMAALPEPSKYNYRGGPQPVPYPQEVGMVAQEVEKVAPGAVSNTPAGKALDGGKMAVMALAGASRANKKLDALANMLMSSKIKLAAMQDTEQGESRAKRRLELEQSEDPYDGGGPIVTPLSTGFRGPRVGNKLIPRGR